MKKLISFAAAAVVVGIALAPLVALAHDETRTAADARRRQVERVALAQADQAAAKLPAELRADLRVTVVDERTRQAVPALVRVTNVDDGKAQRLDGEIHRANNWYSLAPGAKLSLPRRKLRIEALRGLETERGEREVDLSNGAPAAVEIGLRRIFDSRELGLLAGNTHLHLRALSVTEMDRYLRLVPQSDQLDVVFISHLRRAGDDHDYITNTLTEGDLSRLAESGVRFGNGEEHRHNFGPGGEGYGHVMLLNIARLIEPASIGPGIMKTGDDGRTLRTGIQQARGEGATIIWCHNRFGFEDIPNWLAGFIDAQNIHDGGPHGSYDETFYRYLNLGLRVPFSTGTDWFIYDFSRVYVPAAANASSRDWLKSLAAGRSTITNGPLIRMRVESHEPGAVIAMQEPGTVRVHAEGTGRLDFRGLEIVHNGRVVHTITSSTRGGHFVARGELALNIVEPGWVAVRIPWEQQKNELGQTLFAHTSPVYFELAGKRVFQHDAADALLGELRRALEVIPRQGRFTSDRQRDELLDVYRSAIQTLEQRKAEHRATSK